MLDAQTSARRRAKRRRIPQRHRAALWQEAALGVFRAQPHFDRMAVELHVRLRQWQRLAGGDKQLQRDQVEPGDGFGHRVLDLQPRVHLHEVVVPVAVEQKFERARAFAGDGLDGRHRRGAHARAQLGRDRRRGRFLDQLLVAPLHRALALAEVDRVAVAIGEHLDLDVPRLDDGLLEDDGGIAERVLRLRLRAAQHLGELGARVHEPHAAPATARYRLDHHRPADALGLAHQH